LFFVFHVSPLVTFLTDWLKCHITNQDTIKEPFAVTRHPRAVNLEELGIEHKNFLATIRKYQDDLMDFGGSRLKKHP